MNKYVHELNEQINDMTALEALKAGLVVRAIPEYICGSIAPESGPPVICEMEPGHDERRGHQAHQQPSMVSWA